MEEIKNQLHECCREGNYEKVKELVKLRRVDVNAIDKIDMTPLMIACYYGYLEIAKLLIKNGADVNAKDKWDTTALTYACKHGKFEIAELLLDNGAKVDLKDGGTTALMRAVYKGQFEIVKVLVKNGADPTIKSKEGKTAMDYAKEKHAQYIKRKKEYEENIKFLEEYIKTTNPKT